MDSSFSPVHAANFRIAAMTCSSLYGFEKNGLRASTREESKNPEVRMISIGGHLLRMIDASRTAQEYAEGMQENTDDVGG